MDEFRKGDTKAFDWMYRHFYGSLYSMGTRFLRNGEEARDIVADAFLRLWNDRQRHNNLESVSIYLFLFVKHRCYDLLRNRSMKQEHHQKLLHLLDATTETDLTTELVRLELFKIIYTEAENLPEKMRQVFELTYKEGMKPSQIADKLNVSVHTVKNQRMAAIKTLKKLLENKPILLTALLLMEAEQNIFINY